MTLLDVFGLLVLAMLVGIVFYLLYFLGGLPGRIAKDRKHPQADAVNICGWLGLMTGVSWVVAMVWAFWRYPGRDVMAAVSASDEVAQRIGELESRLHALESQLAPQGGDKS